MIAVAIVASILLACLRLVALLWGIRRIRLKGKFSPENFKAKDNVKVLSVVGSGGHTKEMLVFMRNIGAIFTPRYYIVAETDELSVGKIVNTQLHLQDTDYSIIKIPRSRQVHQSYASSIYTTLKAAIYTLPIVFKIKPNVLLCNGPGTCIPICLAAFICKLLFIHDIKLVYVESICRVTSLSLSGKLLYPLADSFIVQWPDLADKYKMAAYIGRLL